MSGYYPDGVTGNEYAIAGAEREYQADREVWCTNDDCLACGDEITMTLDLESYGNTEWATWNCLKCSKENEYQGEVSDHEDDDDPDYYNDLMREDTFIYEN
jgi:hypothetical protein